MHPDNKHQQDIAQAVFDLIKMKEEGRLGIGMVLPPYSGFSTENDSNL